MISRVRRQKGLLRAIIYSLPVFAFLISGYQRFGSNVLLPSYNDGSYLFVLLFSSLVWPFLSDRYAISSFEELYRENTALVRSLFASAILLVLESAMLALTKTLVVSRVFMILTAVNVFGLAVCVRALFRRFVTNPSSRKIGEPLRILVIGADKHAHWAAIRLNRTALPNCKIVGFVSLPGQTIRVNGAPIIGFERLQEFHDFPIDNVLVAVGPERYAEVAKLYGILKKLGKPVNAVIDFGSRIRIQELVCQIGRMQVMNLEPSATDGFDYSVLKRVFDLFFSGFALLVLGPLMGAIAVLVRITSTGPILFRQERVGLNGERFWMYKFRTMHWSDSEQSDTRWTTKNDPRRTNLGAFLRKTSLDELPQLFNVLRGEMSIVGPRPERPHFVSQFRTEVERYDLRHRAKVGITGWAQVNGLRGDTSIRRRVNYDVYYLQHWTFAFDLKIIFLTLRSLIFDQNAY
jgi:Undecaprenyl-phosphate glucose phosphotransferase